MGKTSGFGDFAKSASKAKSKPKLEIQNKTKYMQCRAYANDAKRFKRAAEDRDLSVHAALIEGANRMMQEWGEAPIANAGTYSKPVTE